MAMVERDRTLRCLFSIHYRSDGWGERETIDWLGNTWVVAYTGSGAVWHHFPLEQAHYLKVLKHFKLEYWTEEIPFDDLFLFRSPKQLDALRREKKMIFCLAYHEVRSDAPDHRLAEEYE